MDIIHQVSKNSGCFYYENNEARVAEITYFKHGYNKMIIDSSFIHPSLNKKEILKQLMTKVFDFVTLNNLQIISLCGDVKQLANENEKYATLIYTA